MWRDANTWLRIVVAAVACLVSMVRPAGASERCSPGEVLAALRAGGFARIDRMSGFPSEFLAEFWHALPSDLHDEELRSFAEPGSKFQANDAIENPGLPRRRLLFGGSSSDVTFIYYEKGGRGLSRYVFVACSADRRLYSFSSLTAESAENASALFQMLRPECLVSPPREYLESSELEPCLRNL